MAVYEFRTTQTLPTSLTELWSFISSPENLSKITPEYMRFAVTSQNMPKKMYPGMMITYRVSPLPGFRVSWCTEITQVKENHYFVDEQREGPYTIWHHQHHVYEVDGGVKMTDIIHYKIPFGIIGRIANALFVRKQLNTIFQFRFQKLEALYGKM